MFQLTKEYWDKLSHFQRKMQSGQNVIGDWLLDKDDWKEVGEVNGDFSLLCVCNDNKYRRISTLPPGTKLYHDPERAKRQNMVADRYFADFG